MNARLSSILCERTVRGGAWCIVLLCWMAGCGEDVQGGPVTRGLGLDNGPATGAASAIADTGDSSPKAPLPAVVYRDDDFVESERNRDPFRSEMAVVEPGQVSEISQRKVIMPTTAIESMRLIAIVSGVERPRAMILDPAEVGHVVERGMFLGRAQVVQASGNVAMTLNWRVDRIRENEVVLSRQDPTDPTKPPLIRVIPLHEEVAAR